MTEDSHTPTTPVAQSPAVLLYMPVLHDGYLHFFAKYPDVTTVYLIPNEIAYDLKSLVKDIRAVPTTTMQQVLQALFPNMTIELATTKTLQELAKNNAPIIAPYEDITRHTVSTYLPENEIQFDTIFLRWNRENAQKLIPPSPDRTTLPAQFANRFMAQAFTEAASSSDWWRQVGAVVVRDGTVLLSTYNTHLPSEQQQYINGDPRALFSSGENIEITSSIHAEARLISEAAKQGVSLQDTAMYVSTFPCPPCAKLIANSGIQELYYADGYSLLDGEDILKKHGVEIIRLEPEH